MIIHYIAETKREEAARFIRAKSDPAFAKMVRVRQLGPEQVENQKKIRLAVEVSSTSERCCSNIDIACHPDRRSEVESNNSSSTWLLSKARSTTIESANHPSSKFCLYKDLECNVDASSVIRTPSLDSVHRAVRNITAALTEKTFELDDLGNRLDLLRLKPSSSSVSTPSTSRSRKPISTPDDAFLVASTRKGLAKTPQVTPPEAIATAKAALNAERKAAMLHRALLVVRSNPVINRTASASTSKTMAGRPLSDLQLAFSAGPVTGEHLPSPRRAVVKAALPKPAPTTSFEITQPAFSKTTPPYTTSSYRAPAETLVPALSFTPTVAQTTPSSAKPFGFSTTPKVEPPSANSWKLPPAPAPNPSFIPLFSGPLSFSMPSATAPAPVVGSGARSGASRNSRQHSSAVQLRNTAPSSASTPTPSAAFDWGIPTSTPGRSSPSRVVEGFVPFSNVVQPSVTFQQEEAGSEGDEDEYSADEEEDVGRERGEEDEEGFSDGSDFDQDEEDLLTTIPEESED